MMYSRYKGYDGEWYYESDQEGNVYRQISKAQDQIVKLSNQRQSLYEMLEHPIDSHDDDWLPISRADFEAEWLRCNAEYMSEWEEAKAANEVGNTVKGRIEVIFPQGIIIHLNEIQYPGLVDYWKFAQHAQTENIYPNVQLIGTVAGYDEDNGWIKLEDARLLEERKDD